MKRTYSISKLKNKILAVIITLILFFGMLFSYEYIVEHAHHDCTGEDCPICMQIESAVHMIATMRFVQILPVTLAVLCVLTFLSVTVFLPERSQDTLITWKTEMLN